MRLFKLPILLLLFMSMIGNVAHAFDIAVENEDGVTIYYNWINDKMELEVTYRSMDSRSYIYYGYENIESISIPKTVTYNGNEYNVTSIGDNAFSGCSGLTSVTIPKSAFSRCSGLTSITIPNSVTSIGNHAFSGCTGLTSINIPNNITNIGSRAFSNCSDLTIAVIGNSVTSIEEWTFYGCTDLKEITIPENVTNIGNKAFDSCDRLRKVICLSSTPPIIVSGSFPNRSNQTLYVPKGCRLTYEDADYWWEFKEIFEQGSSQGSPKGDMNGDGVVDISDALVIIDIVLGRK